MALFFTGNDFNGYTASNNGHTYLTRENEYVTNNSTAFTFEEVEKSTYVVEGSVISDGVAINSYLASKHNNLAIKSTGVVHGGDMGMHLQGNYNEVVNDGSIASSDGTALYLNGLSGRITNSGKIAGDYAGIAVKGGGKKTILNTGEISSQSDGVQLYADAGSTTKFYNSGTVSTASTYQNDDAIVGGVGQEKIYNSGQINGDVALGGGNDLFDSKDGHFTGYVTGGLGNDTVIGSDKGDALYGDVGFDLLKGGNGDDTLYGGADYDRLYGGAGQDTLNAGEGDDQLHGGFGNDYLLGAKGDDTLKGNSGDDTMLGGDDNDILYGQKGDDALDGGTGFDTLNGGQGEDTLDGGGRNDKLNGGGGNDHLTGGGGADIFIFYRKAGDDVVTDFTDGMDKIDLSDFGLKNFNRLISNDAINDVEGGIKIDLEAIGGDGSILREDVAINELTASDSIF